MKRSAESCRAVAMRSTRVALDPDKTNPLTGLSGILYPVLFLAALLLTSCEKNVSPPKENQNPGRGFNVQAITEGLPQGSKVSAIAHYYVKDDQCIAVDYTKAVGGARIGTARQEYLQVSHAAENKFSVMAFDDFYLPTVMSAGYGPCEFSLVSVSFKFKVNGVTRTTWIGRKEIDEGSVRSAECGYSEIDRISDVCILRADAGVGTSTFTVTTRRISTR